MPIFEYRCGRCATRFETLVSRAEVDLPQPCPACGVAVGGRDHPEDRLLSVFASVGAAGEGDAPAAAPGCGPVGGFA